MTGRELHVSDGSASGTVIRRAVAQAGCVGSTKKKAGMHAKMPRHAGKRRGEPGGHHPGPILQSPLKLQEEPSTVPGCGEVPLEEGHPGGDPYKSLETEET